MSSLFLFIACRSVSLVFVFVMNSRYGHIKGAHLISAKPGGSANLPPDMMVFRWLGFGTVGFLKVW